MTDERKSYRTGMISVICCMVIWGFMPIYWKSLIPISSYVIILYRIFLSWVTCFVGALKAYGIKELAAPLKDKKKLATMILAGLVITVNWNTYIYAINSGQAIETCIGYYIDPLVVCVFGILFFKERPTKYKFISIIFACIGVFIVLIYFMRVPIIALSLALSFATYTAMKKHLKMPALISLFYELLCLAPIALVILISTEIRGVGAFSAAQPHQLLLLALIGVFTSAPLALFAVGTNRISMISIGIIEYIGPSITLLIGIFLFREPFDLVQFIAFAVIWVGLIFFTYGEIKENRKNG